MTTIYFFRRPAPPLPLYIIYYIIVQTTSATLAETLCATTRASPCRGAPRHLHICLSCLSSVFLSSWSSSTNLFQVAVIIHNRESSQELVIEECRAIIRFLLPPLTSSLTLNTGAEDVVNKTGNVLRELRDLPQPASAEYLSTMREAETSSR